MRRQRRHRLAARGLGLRSCGERTSLRPRGGPHPRRGRGSPLLWGADFVEARTSSRTGSDSSGLRSFGERTSLRLARVPRRAVPAPRLRSFGERTSLRQPVRPLAHLVGPGLRSFGERTSLRREDVAGVVILLAVSAPSGTDFVSDPGPRRGRAQTVFLPGQFARLCRGRGTSTGSNHARDVRARRHAFARSWAWLHGVSISSESVGSQPRLKASRGKAMPWANARRMASRAVPR